MVRVFWVLCPVLTEIAKVFAADRIPGRPVPVNCTETVPALVDIVAVAVLIVPVGVKTTVSVCGLPTAKLNELGVMLETSGLPLLTVPVRFPLPFFPEFLMVKLL